MNHLGSWSDRHKRRKPCMMIPLIGEMLAALSLIACVYNKNWSLEMTVFFEVIFPALTGRISYRSPAHQIDHN